MSRAFSLMAAVLLAFVAPVAANTPSLSREDTEKAMQLLRKLGAKEYRIREGASVELVRMGRAVEPILRQGMTDSDPEIRYRSRYLLPLAMTYDLEKRIKAFLADKDDKSPLPGWAKFKDIVGDDAKTREMFSSMHRYDTALIELMDKNAPGLQAKLSTQCNDFMLSRNGQGFNAPVHLEQVAVLLFAVADAKLKADMSVRSNLSSALYMASYAPSGKNVLKGNDVVRKLVVKYLNNWNEFSINNDVYVLINLDLKEGTQIAREMLKKSSGSAYGRAMAMGALAKLGGKEVIPEILPFIEDKASCGDTQFGFNNKNVTIHTQLRDVALALLVHLTGQNLNNYDFAYVKMFPGNFAANNLFMSPTLLGFSDDKARDASMKKWKEWFDKEKATNPLLQKLPAEKKK